MIQGSCTIQLNVAQNDFHKCGKVTLFLNKKNKGINLLLLKKTWVLIQAGTTKIWNTYTLTKKKKAYTLQRFVPSLRTKKIIYDE